MTFQNIYFQNRLLSFVIFLIVFRPTCSSVSVKKGHNLFSVSYDQIFITVLASNFYFSVMLHLLLRDFIKMFQILYICTF